MVTRLIGFEGWEIVPDLRAHMRAHRVEAEARNAVRPLWEMPEDTGEGSVIVRFGPGKDDVTVIDPFADWVAP